MRAALVIGAALVAAGCETEAPDSRAPDSSIGEDLAKSQPRALDKSDPMWPASPDGKTREPLTDFGDPDVNEPLPPGEAIDSVARRLSDARATAAILEREVGQLGAELRDSDELGLEARQRELERAVRRVARLLERLERKIAGARGS